MIMICHQYIECQILQQCAIVKVIISKNVQREFIAEFWSIIDLINSLIIGIPEESIQNAKFFPLKIIGYETVNVDDYPVDKIEINE